MERLTERCAGGIRIKGCSTLYADKERKGAPASNAIARLSAYEDAMPLERAQELAQAEKDGRLVILPDAKYTEADGEKALQKAMWICGNANNPVTRYTADAIAEKLCREVKDENLSLTLEELREMDGEPVWIVSTRGSGWCIVNWLGINQSWMYYSRTGTAEGMTATPISARDYGDTWLAYRRKPEEGTE